MKNKWFHPKKHTGWRKTQKASTRRFRLLDSTDKRKSMHNRYLEAGRKAQALANVTEDSETKRKAKSDAEYFFDKLR